MLKFILYLLIIFFIIYLVDSIIGMKLDNIYTCTGIFGKPGSGKSLFLTWLAYKHVKKQWVVYCDFPCYIDGVKQFDDDHFKRGIWLPDGRNKEGEIEQNILILIDEIGTLFNNRDFKTNFTPATLKFWKEHRHRGIKIIYASQSYADMDKKLRDLTDIYYLMKNSLLKTLRIAKLIKVDIDITNNDQENGGKIIDIYKFAPFIQFKFIYLPKWIKKFNSFA